MTTEIQNGTRLGPYEIVSRIGAGGMGEVFRAKDTRLDRSVAIKILPPALAHDAQFRARFEREAKLVSSLNHPNICTLHDVGNAEGVEFLVMELLEGETLADRLAKGPLPIAQLLSIGMQIASALEKAHRQGVVHRDLKPGNVMLTKGGAKLLDFGLAKNQEVVRLGGSSLDYSGATEQRPLTQEGTILGTFQYMAPEQLDGVEAGARTDIFAFGAVLYEMATGKRAFEGRTRSSLIAAIVQGRPRPISELQPLTPPALKRLIASCLEKDPDDRIQTAHDVWIQLKWMAEGGSEAGIAAPVLAKRRRLDRLKWIAACAGAAAIAAAAAWTMKPGEPVPGSSFEIPGSTPAYWWAGRARISPDGTRLVFRAQPQKEGGANQSNQLVVRAVDSLDLVFLPGTENSEGDCFWSPDGTAVAFSQNGRLMKMPAGGGAAQKIASLPLPGFTSGAWSSDGTILIASAEAPLGILPPGASSVKPLTTLDRSKSETAHASPQFLPNGRDFLFIANTKDRRMQGDRQRLYAGSTESKKVTFIQEISSEVHYADGMLLYVRDGTLLAQPFDARAMKFTGDSRTVLQNVAFFEPTGDAALSVSINGVLVVQGPTSTIRGFRASADGSRMIPFGGERGFTNFRISPDGKELVAAVPDLNIGGFDLWLYGIDRPTSRRLTSDRGWENHPVWSPDSKSIYYGSDSLGLPDIFRKVLDGTSNDELVLQAPFTQNPRDVSADGRYLLYDTTETGKDWDINVLPLDTSAKSFPFVKTPSTENLGRFSPDGRHVAYRSTESGTAQIYVRPFPGPGSAEQISTGEASGRPKWDPEGRRILFRSGLRRIMAVGFDPVSGKTTGEPSVILERHLDISDFEVMRGGDFLLTLSDHNASPPNRVYTRWKRLLK